MLAVDTNVVVRFLTDDDPNQGRIARRLIDTHKVRLLSTVLLETEWVLRSLYGYSAERVHAGLLAFVGLHNVVVEKPTQVTQALVWVEQGMDFADALHLAGCMADDEFTTFDRKLAAAARKVKAGKVKVL